MRFTMPIKMNHDFKRVYAKGKSAATSRMVLYCRPNGKSYSRLGIAVSTKLGKAVVRNKIKRRFREIYRLNEERLLCGQDVVIVGRTKSTTAEYSDLDGDFLFLARRLGLLKEED